MIPYAIDFRRPENADDLSEYLGISQNTFQKVISSPSRREFYFKHEIPKRSRRRQEETRTVWQTGRRGYHELVDGHKAFARRFDLFARLADPRYPHDAAYGYIRHRGTRDNAAIHCGAARLLRADLKDFFPSITAERLSKRFTELGLNPKVAEALSAFATIEDRLPLGLNASPMLANLVCVKLDIALADLAERCGCSYTRYADDLSMSGTSLPSRDEIENLIVKQGFALNKDKFRITKNGQAHFVTGLSISDQKGPHVPRRMKRRLRQELYYCEKFGVEDHLARIGYEKLKYQSGINRIDGTVRYVAHVEGQKIARRIRPIWQAMLEREVLQASYPSAESNEVRYVECFVDESEIVYRGQSYLALGLVFTEDSDVLAAATISTLRAHQISDPFYAGDKEALDKRGLHFVDAHPDLRTAFIKALAGLPYRAFVIYGTLDVSTSYEDLYLSLLKAALRNRFVWYDRALIDIHVEENSKINRARIEGAVREVYAALEGIESRRPLTQPTTEVAGKRDMPHFAVPDFLLAVFARYAQRNEYLKEPLREHQFERLRDRYRSIVDFDTGIEFSRRRPFSPWNASSRN